MSKVKIQHHLPRILRKRHIPPSLREYYPGFVYNELFRALASQGRDAEFLSIWAEAKSRTTVLNAS